MENNFKSKKLVIVLITILVIVIGIFLGGKYLLEKDTSEYVRKIFKYRYKYRKK